MTGHERSTPSTLTERTAVVANDSEAGQWSPDGTHDPFFTPLGEGNLNLDTGSFIDLRLPRSIPTSFFCGVWSPDGARLACEGGSSTRA